MTTMMKMMHAAEMITMATLMTLCSIGLIEDRILRLRNNIDSLVHAQARAKKICETRDSCNPMVTMYSGTSHA